MKAKFPCRYKHSRKQPENHPNTSARPAITSLLSNRINSFAVQSKTGHAYYRCMTCATKESPATPVSDQKNKNCDTNPPNSNRIKGHYRNSIPISCPANPLENPANPLNPFSARAHHPLNWRLWSRNRRVTIFLAAAIAFVAKLLLALNTYGTNDVYTYERFALWSRYFGADLYQIAPDLNHPPSMLHILRLLLWLSEHTRLPFYFWIRIPGILADLGTLWLVCRIFGPRLRERSIGIAVLFIAIAPTHILISGFHGNTDPVMIFFVMAAVWLAGYRDKPFIAGVAFGMALCIKVAPLILVPVLFLWLSGIKKRLAFFASAAAVSLAAWSPYVFQRPSAVLHQVFGYKGSYGLWGFSWLFRELASAWPASHWINDGFSRFGTPLVVVAILALSVAMNRLPQKPSLYTQVGMILLLFFTATSGFAVQYLAWLTPWVAELGVVPVGLFILTGSFFLLVVYNYWTLGMPWYLAIAYPWSSHQYFQVLCWISVLLLTLAAWHRITGFGSMGDRPFAAGLRERFAQISPAFRLTAAAAGLAAFLIVPAIVHMRRDTFGRTPAYDRDVTLFTQAGEYYDLAAELSRRGRASESDAVERRAVSLDMQARHVSAELARIEPARFNLRTPEDSVYASLDDYNNGDFTQCVADARDSLRLRPGMSAAWNNISLCSAELGDWNAAVAAAEDALRSEPESDSVRENLKRALEGQSRALLIRK
jgi:hypothetical protein